MEKRTDNSKKDWLSSFASASDNTKGYLIALVGTLIWSTTAIFIRYLNNVYAIPPLALAVWRDAFVALALAVVLWIRQPSLLRIKRSMWRFFLGYGLTLSIFNTLWTYSVKLNGAAISVVLVYSSAAYTAILGRWLFKERLGLSKLTAIGLSLIGMVLVSGAFTFQVWQVNAWGILVGVGSGLAFTIYSLMGREVARRKINSWSALLHSFWIAAVFLLLFNIIPDGGVPFVQRLFWLGDAWVGWGILIILAIGPSLGGYGLYNLSLHYLPASVANLIATLEPPLTTLQAYLFLAERLNFYQVIGSLLILSGLVVLRVVERRGRDKNRLES